MDEILQLSPIREGKLQEDLQTMLISSEKKVTIHSKIIKTLAVLELTNSCTPPTWSEEMLNGISLNLPTRSLKTVPLSINFAHLALNHFHIRRKKIEYMMNKLFLQNSKS